MRTLWERGWSLKGYREGVFLGERDNFGGDSVIDLFGVDFI